MQLELNHRVGVGFSGIPFVYLFVHHPFSKHFLSTCCVPGTRWAISLGALLALSVPICTQRWMGCSVELHSIKSVTKITVK